MKKQAVGATCVGVALLFLGCTGAAGVVSSSAGTEVSVQSTSALLVTIAPEGVEQVDFAVFSGDAPQGEPVVTQTVQREAGGEFRHTLSDLLEVGTYVFTAQALDAAGEVLFRGEAVADIEGGELTTVVVVMTSEPVEVSSNTAPRINGLVISNSQPAQGETLVLDVDASDADGDPLVATWAATGGEFAGSTSDDALDESWSSDEVGDFVLTVSVADDQGAAASFSMNIAVVTGVGSADVSVEFNTRPTVLIEATDVTTGEADVANSQISLRAVAEDPDGDDITFRWSTTCDGAFGPEGTDVAETTFIPTSAGSCSFTVDAADDGGANASVLIVDVACVPLFDEAQMGLNACALIEPVCVAEGDPCEGLVCGSATDSCGEEVACGECADGEVCSEDQASCQCVPDAGACGDRVCGEVTEAACGTTLDCGQCADGESCSEDQTQCVAPEPVIDSCRYMNPFSVCAACREYPAGYANAGGDDAATECASNPVSGAGPAGEFSADVACPRDGLVGKCENPDGTVDFIEGARPQECDLNLPRMNAARACVEIAGGTWTCLL